MTTGDTLKKSTYRLLFDTNVLLDALLERAPRQMVAARLISTVEEGHLTGFVAGTSLTTCHYIVRRSVGAKRAREAVRLMLGIFEVAPIDDRVLESALELPFRDFEDAVLHEAARMVSVTTIVTSNVKDFRKAKLDVVTPESLWSTIALER